MTHGEDDPDVHQKHLELEEERGEVGEAHLLHLHIQDQADWGKGGGDNPDNLPLLLLSCFFTFCSNFNETSSDFASPASSLISMLMPTASLENH